MDIDFGLYLCPQCRRQMRSFIRKHEGHSEQWNVCDVCRLRTGPIGRPELDGEPSLPVGTINQRGEWE